MGMLRAMRRLVVIVAALLALAPVASASARTVTCRRHARSVRKLRVDGASCGVARRVWFFVDRNGDAVTGFFLRRVFWAPDLHGWHGRTQLWESSLGGRVWIDWRADGG